MILKRKLDELIQRKGPHGQIFHITTRTCQSEHENFVLTEILKQMFLFSLFCVRFAVAFTDKLKEEAELFLVIFSFVFHLQ